MNTVDILTDDVTFGKIVDGTITEFEDDEIISAKDFVQTYAFYGCEELTRVSLPNFAGDIPQYCFQNCSNLSSVSIPHVRYIGKWCFRNDAMLRSIDLESATQVGEDAFNGCSALETANFPNVSIVSQNAFEASYFRHLTFPNLKSVKSRALCNCSSLESITFDTLSEIEMGAFSYCPRLTKIIVQNTPSSLMVYGKNHFEMSPNCIVYVPEDAVALFQSKLTSITSSRIKPLSELPAEEGA